MMLSLTGGDYQGLNYLQWKNVEIKGGGLETDTDDFVLKF